MPFFVTEHQLLFRKNWTVVTTVLGFEKIILLTFFDTFPLTFLPNSVVDLSIVKCSILVISFCHVISQQKTDSNGSANDQKATSSS